MVDLAGATHGSPFEEIAGLDRLIHDPSRLAILTAVQMKPGLDYMRLHRLTGLGKGNLSAHLMKLENAGMVFLWRRFVGKRTLTTVNLTPEGLARICGHWEKLGRLREDAQAWSERQDAPRTENKGATKHV